MADNNNKIKFVYIKIMYVIYIDKDKYILCP